MKIKNNIVGDGSSESPFRPALSVSFWESWERSGNDTATVTLTDEATRQAKSDAVDAALALNSGSPWADVKGVFSGDPLVPAIKKWLAQGTDSDGPVKKKFGEFSGSVPQGFVVSHDAALWKATSQTTAEPSTTSDDWTQIFSL